MAVVCAKVQQVQFAYANSVWRISLPDPWQALYWKGIAQLTCLVSDVFGWVGYDRHFSSLWRMLKGHLSHLCLNVIHSNSKKRIIQMRHHCSTLDLTAVMTRDVTSIHPENDRRIFRKSHGQALFYLADFLNAKAALEASQLTAKDALKAALAKAREVDVSKIEVTSFDVFVFWCHIFCIILLAVYFLCPLPGGKQILLVLVSSSPFYFCGAVLAILWWCWLSELLPFAIVWESLHFFGGVSCPMTGDMPSVAVPSCPFCTSPSAHMWNYVKLPWFKQWSL